MRSEFVSNSILIEGVLKSCPNWIIPWGEPRQVPEWQAKEGDGGFV